MSKNNKKIDTHKAIQQMKIATKRQRIEIIKALQRMSLIQRFHRRIHMGRNW